MSPGVHGRPVSQSPSRGSPAAVGAAAALTGDGALALEEAADVVDDLERVVGAARVRDRGRFDLVARGRLGDDPDLTGAGADVEAGGRGRELGGAADIAGAGLPAGLDLGGHV